MFFIPISLLYYLFFSLSTLKIPAKYAIIKECVFIYKKPGIKTPWRKGTFMLTKEQFDARLSKLVREQEELLARPNPASDFYNGIYTRYQNPVLTAAHAPIIWRYDLSYNDNPNLMERLGVNAVMNSGAVYLNGKYCLVARVEGADRKSFFAVAESDKPTEGFRFRDYPVILPDTCPEETNVYDMRLTQHEDGWIYGVFCSESKDKENPDLSAATAQAGIVRTRDLVTWERLPNLISKSPQQRNVVLHPEFVNGMYAFYTRPQDHFISTGSGGGVCFALCKDITNPVLCTDEVVDLSESLPHYHRGQERRRRCSDKDTQGLDTHCPRRKEYCGWPALRHLRIRYRPQRSLPNSSQAHPDCSSRPTALSASATFPTLRSLTEPSSARTAAFISTTLPPIQDCMLLPRPLSSSWTTHSTHRPTRSALLTA